MQAATVSPDSIPCSVTKIYPKVYLPTQIDISWDSVGDGSYIFEYKLSNDTTGNWSQIVPPIPYRFVSIQNQIGTNDNYLARVISKCNNSLDTSPIFSFNRSSSCSKSSVWLEPLTDSTVMLYTRNSIDTTYAARVNISSYTSNFSNSYLVKQGNLLVTDLPKCDRFRVFAFTICTNDSSQIVGPPGMILDFRTLCTSQCRKISSFSYTQPDEEHIDYRVSWFGTDANKFIVEYKLAADSASGVWNKDSTNYPNYDVKKFILGENYLFRVIQTCYGKPDTSFTFLFPTNCPRIQNLSLITLSDSAVSIRWDKLNGDLNHFSIRVASDDNTFSRTYITNDTSITLKNLPLGKSYLANVTRLCNSGKETQSYTVWFSMCERLVKNIKTTSSSDSTNISWDSYNYALSNSTVYEVQFKSASDSIWSSKIQVNNESTTLRGLNYCGDYIVRIRVKCNFANFSDWATLNFRAGNRCFRIGDKSANTTQVTGIKISPNPGSTSAVVEFQLAHESAVTIKFYNTLGIEVLNTSLGNINAGIFFQNFENLNSLPTGLYLVSLQADGDVPQIMRWVKL